jgi:hypothetical protein
MEAKRKVVSFKPSTPKGRVDLLSRKIHTIQDNQAKEDKIIDVILFLVGVGLVCLVLI